MQNISIFVSGLRKSYQNKEVLKNVNFSVPGGTIYALLGSNGAGKTTIVKILATLLKPDGGNAAINVFDVVSQEERVRKCISLTGQFTAVDEVLTGRENLNLIGQLMRLSDVKSKTNEWLSFFGLQDASDRKVSTYSGGMRRRLDIAMSLIGNPKVLFLDEPTTGLDPQNRIAMWDLVKNLAMKGTTVFLTTQYLEEAEYLADNVAILHKGKILVEGTPEYLKEIVPQQGAQLNFESEGEASLRNPEALLAATIVPFILMFLFGSVLGNIANVGNFNYIDFIVPGIILQSIGQSSQYSAMNVAADMTKGIIDRFRTMSISKVAVLIGHTGAGVVRNTISTITIIGTALILGFRPQGSFLDWFVIVGLLTLVNIAISLLAVMCGLLSKTVEGSSGLMLPLFILPFLSSGFVPVNAMDGGIQKP